MPKSAGSSIHEALKAAFSPESVSPRRCDVSTFCDFTDFDSLGPEARAMVAVDDDELDALSKYRVISGHFHLATLSRFAPSSAIATVLREPRARLLSLYAYSRLTPGVREFWHPYGGEFEYARKPLDEFLSEPRMAIGIDNLTCRMLIAADTRIPTRDFIAAEDIPSSASDAIERLDELGFVGLVELGDSAWEGLSRIFGTTLVPNRVNVTSKDASLAATLPALEPITDRTIELLEQRSAADAIVYKHVLARAGIDGPHAERVRDAAFAAQLVRYGDVAGRSAQQRAVQAAELGELRGLVAQKEEEVGALTERLELALAELDRHRNWLADIHGSLSWRLTAPLRSAKRAGKRLGGSR